MSERSLSTDKKRRASIGGRSIRRGIFLHITVDTPGEYASVVPKAAPGVSELDLTVAKPPADGEWLDGETLLFVRHDHMCLCTTGLRDAAITTFLYDFFKKAGIRKDLDKFDLKKVADVSKLKMLHAQGVREVTPENVMIQATADY